MQADPTSPSSGDGIETSCPGVFDRLPTRYDLLLACVPLLFLVCLGAEWALSLPDRAGLVAASLGAAVVLADALFINPPQRA